jgi:FkbM family methyltransferase
MTRGVYEAPLMSAMSDAVRPGWVCFDVGAHSGYHSLVLAALTGNEGRVHAFEPLPFNLRRLTTTIERNNLGSIVHVHAIALSDRNGPAAIVGSASARGSGRGVLVGGRGEASLRRRGFPEIAVEQRRIDDLIGQDGIAAPQFIKVDVEGAEPAVLRGAMNTLHTIRPVLAIEVHSAASAVECADLLTSLGYRLRVIEDQEDVRCLVLATPTPSRGT